MALLRQDGSYIIYIIQHEKHDGSWSQMASLDYFGLPEGFGAMHPCWQTTGIDGTFDLSRAEAALEWLAKKWGTVRPEDRWRRGGAYSRADTTAHKFRIAQVTIAQITELV